MNKLKGKQHAFCDFLCFIVYVKHSQSSRGEPARPHKKNESIGRKFSRLKQSIVTFPPSSGRSNYNAGK